MAFLLLLGSLLIFARSQTVCNSDVILYEATCPADQTALDCSYLSQNFDAICGLMESNTVGNGPSCSLYSNCTFSSAVAATNSVFCCVAATVAPTATIAPTATVTDADAETPITSHSASASLLPEARSTATVTTTNCPYRIYDASTDFSSTQGFRGWYYGYYSGTTFTQFTHYGVSSTMSVGSVNSWNYNPDSNGIISSNMIMPNGAVSCNTNTFGNVAPVLRWRNPVGSCYSDVTITLYVNRPSPSGSGVALSLNVNGDTVYSGSQVSVTSFTRYFNAYNVNSIEFTVSPNNNNCDYAQLTYGLTISPMGPSTTARGSASGWITTTTTSRLSHTVSITNSSRLSRSVSGTMSRSGSPSISNSPRPSFTGSITGTATATVFYYGVWTDMAQFNYPGGDLPGSPLGGRTINQCKIACWQNPLCGVIVVTSPCTFLNHSSSEADTTVCGNCWLKGFTGWAGPVEDTESHGYILYNRVYPPTVTVQTSRSSSATPRASLSSLMSPTSTRSSLPSTTLRTFFTYNMCADSGNIFLPTLGSSASIYTNAPGSQYGDGWVCGVNVNGYQPGFTTVITFSSFVTELNCDFIRVYNSANTLLYTFSGTTVPPPLYVNDYVRISFATDGSVVNTGVAFSVRLELATPSASVSVSRSALRSLSSSGSALTSRSPSLSPRETSLNTDSSSVTISRFSTFTPSASNTSRAGGFTPTNSFTVSSTSSSTVSPQNTGSLISTNSNYPSSSFCKTHSESNSYSPSASASSSPSLSPSVSGSSRPSESSSASVSGSEYYTYSVVHTISPTSSPAPSPSGSVSSSSTSSSSVSAIASTTTCGSKTNARSMSVSYSRSFCPSVSVTPAPTRTSTSSLTLSKTPTASYLYRPKLKTAPALPADLSSMSSDDISNAISDLGNYDPSLVRNNLQVLGAAALFKMDGPLSISTDTFALTMSKLGNSSTNPISTEGLDAVLPEIPVAGAAATSVIKWVSNPYPNTTAIDSPVVSMSVINMGGSAVSVSNLSVPIRMNWNLDIQESDPRIAAAPSYMVLCATGDIFKSTGATDMVKMSISGPGLTSWHVPCLMGSMRWINCTATDTVKHFSCPVAKLVPRCMYWSNVLGAWAEDGCRAVVGNASTIVCECTHLTDFSARLDAVVTENQAVFNNAANVYSLEGLLKYAKWYGIFGGIGLMTLILGALVTRVDFISMQNYIKAICLNKDVADVLHSVPNTPIFAYDALSTLKETDKKLKHRYVPPHLNVFMRILIQHSRLQFLFRYDPRLSRLFRLLSILLIQFHSLFITALFYGFTYGAGVKNQMQWYDIILLAGLTTALNIPVVRFLVTSMNQVGLGEFKVQFPILFAEYERRVEFEKIALEYLERKRGMKLSDDDSVAEIENNQEKAEENEEMVDNEEEEEVLVDVILYYLCCRQKKRAEVEDLSELTLHQLMRRMATIIKESYPYIEAYPNWYGMMPFHTRGGLLYTLFCIGWIGWCLNYLLLFAAAHSNDVGENIMISYATSEITTVFFTQPVIIGSTYIFYRLLNAYGKYLPPWLYKRLIVKSVKAIPSLYYFSDPLGKKTKTSFSSEFSYNIFVRCAAASMGATEQAYAPQKAIASGHDPSERPIVVEIKKLYKTFIGTWDEIMQR